jgi:3-(3-hydroxy-phenyl)propionate hydroxylase
MYSAFNCDVLIIGGGPTGVTLAALLAKRGVSVIVTEKEPSLYPLPRARRVSTIKPCASCKRRARQRR